LASPRWVARATAVRWTCPPATSPVSMSVTKARRRESVNGLATPTAKVDNRCRIAVVSVVPAMAPASFLVCNTKERRRFRFPSRARPNWVNSSTSRTPLAGVERFGYTLALLLARASPVVFPLPTRDRQRATPSGTVGVVVRTSSVRPAISLYPVGDTMPLVANLTPPAFQCSSGVGVPAAAQSIASAKLVSATALCPT